MAVIPAVQTRVGEWSVFSWSAVTESDTFALPAVQGRVRQATLHVSGTFGGATAVAQGSNDASNWVTLDDAEDTAVSLTAAGFRELRYAWPYVRLSASGGSSQSLNATMAVLTD